MVCSDRAGRIRHSRTWRQDRATPAGEYGYVDLFSWPIRRSDVCKGSTGNLPIGPAGKMPVPQWPLPRKNVGVQVDFHGRRETPRAYCYKSYKVTSLQIEQAYRVNYFALVTLLTF